MFGLLSPAAGCGAAEIVQSALAPSAMSSASAAKPSRSKSFSRGSAFRQALREHRERSRLSASMHWEAVDHFAVSLIGRSAGPSRRRPATARGHPGVGPPRRRRAAVIKLAARARPGRDRRRPIGCTRLGSRRPRRPSRAGATRTAARAAHNGRRGWLLHNAATAWPIGRLVVWKFRRCSLSRGDRSASSSSSSLPCRWPAAACGRRLRHAS